MSHDQPIIETESITEAQRGGSITGIGIVLGFSLTFTGQWTFVPGAWHLSQALALCIAGIGIVFQLISLFDVLSLPLVPLEYHRKVVRRFKFGVAFVLAGFAAHVLFDLMVDVLKWNLP